MRWKKMFHTSIGPRGRRRDRLNRTTTKPTFIDPKTGERIESTRLARWFSGLVYGLGLGPVVGLVIGLVIVLIGVLVNALSGLINGLVITLFLGLFGGLFLALLCGLLGALLPPEMKDARCFGFTRWAHDTLARTQHSRRLKRKLLDEEWANVPDTALSRAQPPGEPTPTDAALSLASNPEATRLTVETVESIEDKVPVRW